MLDELKRKWDEDAFEGLKFLDEIVRKQQDQILRNEACKLVANRIRSSSVFKKQLIYRELGQCSFLCRVYLSFQFRSIHDTAFPRAEILYGRDMRNPAPMIVPPNRQFIQAFGENRYYNLGVSTNGSPVKEPRMVHVPPCQQFSMSCYHTLFLTISGKVYGCGRATNIVVGEQNVSLKSNSIYYIADPILIELPDEEEILAIEATDSCSILVSSLFVYVIGECHHFRNHVSDTKFFSSNGRRYASEGFKSNGFPKILINDENVEIWHFFSSIDERNRKQTFGYECPECVKHPEWGEEDKFFFNDQARQSRNWTKIVLKHDGHIYKLSLSLVDRRLYFTSGINSSVCDFVMNGNVVANDQVEQFKASLDGTVIIQTRYGMLARGKAVLWRDYVARTKFERSKHCSAARCNAASKEKFKFMVVIFFEEIPGSYGVDTFCASPNCDNLIVQYGLLSEKRMESLVTPREKRVWSSEKKGILKDIARGVRKEPNQLFLIKRRAEELRFEVLKSNEKFPHACESINFLKYAGLLEDLNYLLKDSDQFFLMWIHERDKQDRFPETFTWVDVLANIRQFGYGWSDRGSLLKSLMGIEKTLSEPVPEGLEEVIGLLNPLLNILIELVKKVGNGVENEDQLEGSRVVEKMFYPEIECFSLSENLEKIRRNRIDNGDLEENEVPMDLEITFNIQKKEGATSWPNRRYWFYSWFLRTRAIFELKYPFLVDHIVDGSLELTDLAFNYVFSRFDTFYSVGTWTEECVDDFRLEGTRTEVVKRLHDEVLLRVVSKDPITEFVKPGTPNGNILNLVTTDGKIVPVHKYLIVLHSRQISAMLRFHKSCTVANSNSSDDDDEKVKEISHIKVEGTEKVVKEAMSALLDITTLYDKEMAELIDILMFFDYHLMNEAISDVLNIMFQIANATNIECLYDLFEHHEKIMFPKFLEYDYLIFMSNSPCLPPSRLIERIAESGWMDAFENEYYFKWPRENRRIIIETEDIIECFVDLTKDHEEKFWRVLQEEMHMDVDELASYEEEAKLLKKTRKDSHDIRSSSEVSTPVNTIEKESEQESVSE